MREVRAGHATRIWPEVGNPTVSQRTDMKYKIDCPGLTVHDLGEAFTEDFQGRRLWCRRHCEGVFAVEPIWDPGLGQDSGRRFLFSEQIDAAMFRLSWC